MSFESLIDKVKQAESALEAKERETGADWRQLRASWRKAWTPGRIVSIGLVTGFLVGKAEPARRMVRGSSMLQMVGALAGMFAGGSAQTAAAHAEHAAQSATAAAGDAPLAPAQPPPQPSSMHTPESLRAAGML